MPKNLLKVPAHVLARLKSFGQDDVIVACVKIVTPDDASKYSHLGLKLVEGELVAPERQLPNPAVGKYSQANAFGLEKTRKDLPKEKRSYGFWAPNYGDWSKGSHYVSHVREVYPREFYPPKEVELSITSVGVVGDAHKVKFAVEQVINQRTSNFEQELLYNLNILQENVGAADVFPSDATLEEYAKTVRVDWQLLPPGSTDQVMQRLLQGKGKLTPDAEKTMRERVDFIGRLKPEAFIAGTDGFLRYFGAKFADDLVVFENARYGNALYVMHENWEVLSRRSRIDLLAGPRDSFERVEHRKGWKEILRAILNEYRRKQRTQKLI
jgi:hypothetical protein